MYNDWMFVVSSQHHHYASTSTTISAITIKQVIKGLNNKIKRIDNKTEEKVLTLDSYITKNMYHKWSVAWFEGM